MRLYCYTPPCDQTDSMMDKVISFLAIQKSHKEADNHSDHYTCVHQQPCPCNLDMSTALGYEPRLEKTGKLTAFGKQVKYRLIDLCKTQTWLQEQITEKTGLFMDSSYMHKILTGQKNTPKVVQAIREILDIPDATTE